MKIALLTSGILPIPAVQGGAVENLVDFYLAYNDRHKLHDITVFAVDHPAARQHEALKSSVNHYVYIPVDTLLARIRRKLYHYAARNDYYNHFIEYYFEQAYKKLKLAHYDLILLENRPGYALKLYDRGQRNIVLHLHNDLLNSETPNFQKVFQSLSKILTVSHYIEGRVATIQDNTKTRTVYNGIDLAKFSDATARKSVRQKLNLQDDDFVLIYSGRINKDKGISELIDALCLLKDKDNIKLLVVGNPFFGNAANEDSFVKSLKAKAAPVKERILFTGFVPYEAMPQYLSAADVAVVPSVWDDPFPTTVLEAQAMSLPLIVSNRGGIPEEVGPDNAIVVPTGDNFVAGLRQAIMELYQKPEQRAKMAQASKERSSLFQKERFAKDFFQALEEKNTD